MTELSQHSPSIYNTDGDNQSFVLTQTKINKEKQGNKIIHYYTFNFCGSSVPGSKETSQLPLSHQCSTKNHTTIDTLSNIDMPSPVTTTVIEDSFSLPRTSDCIPTVCKNQNQSQSQSVYESNGKSLKLSGVFKNLDNFFNNGPVIPSSSTCLPLILNNNKNNEYSRKLTKNNTCRESEVKSHKSEFNLNNLADLNKRCKFFIFNVFYFRLW
jgi:hypothetical protein